MQQPSGGRLKGTASTAEGLIATLTANAKLLTYPVKFDIREHCAATEAQNNMQHQWYTDAADQDDDPSHDSEHFRSYCKLHFGIPILRRDSEEYRAAYDRTLKSMTYETKIEMMRTPLDWPVTSAMNKRQKSEFLERVQHHLGAKLGFRLTQARQDS